MNDERSVQHADEVVRLDLAALAAHNAFFEPAEQLSGIELELWRNVARAVWKSDVAGAPSTAPVTVRCPMGHYCRWISDGVIFCESCCWTSCDSRRVGAWWFLRVWAGWR